MKGNLNELIPDGFVSSNPVDSNHRSDQMVELNVQEIFVIAVAAFFAAVILWGNWK